MGLWGNNFVVSAKDFDEIAPFSVGTDSKGKIKYLGRTIRRLFPKIKPGLLLSQVFQFQDDLQNPISPSSLPKSFQMNVTGEELNFKCLTIDLKNTHKLFLLIPILKDISQITKYGLKFTDFAVNDPIIDYLLILQLQNRTLQETKELNRELDVAKIRAEEGSRAKSAFLANMSHEIRTPLNAIIGLTSVLLGANLGESAVKSLNRIKSSSDALLSVINDILDFSKIEAGAVKLSNTDFDLLELLDETKDIFCEVADKKKIQLNIDFDPRMNRYINSDKDKVRQILINFLGNAIKFTEVGSVTLRAQLFPGARIKISVSDTGPGIRAEVLKTLFQPFIQGDLSTTKRYGGTGLGLSICERLANVMGGIAGASSQIGKGSEFWVELPFVPATASELNAVRDQLRPLGPETLGRLGNLKILAAEDNQANQEVVEAMAEQLNLKIELVKNGAEAVEKTLSTTYDLILMDCQMPLMDGYDSSRQIRKSDANRLTPIIALTANALSDDKDKCLAAGMNDFLSKPFKIEDLKAMIIKWGLKQETAVLVPSEMIESVIDVTFIDSLKRLQTSKRPHFVQDQVTSFLEEGQTLILEFSIYWNARDLVGLEQAIHRFKSNCGIVGAQRLARVCQSIIHCCRGNKIQELQQNMLNFSPAFEEARSSLLRIVAA